MRPLGPGSPRSSSILLDEAVAEQALPPWPDCDRKGHGRGGDFFEVELELELEEDLEQELEQEQEQEQEQGHDGGESNGGGGDEPAAESAVAQQLAEPRPPQALALRGMPARYTRC